MFDFIGSTVKFSTLEDLVVRGGLERGILQNSVINRMKSRFSQKVALAVYMDDAGLAKELYDWAVELPLTATCAQLAKNMDVIVDGCVYGDNTNLQICFVKGVPSVLKAVTLSEYSRAEALLSAKVEHPNLVKLMVYKWESKHFVIMPLMPITCDHLSGILEIQALKLWDQMSLALDCLHAHGFAHKDVKPSNICIDSNGDFVLIDMGETVPFGIKSNSTAQFVPKDIDASNPADAMIDWWMLIMTVFDRMQPVNEGIPYFRVTMSTSDLMQWFENCQKNVWTKISEKLKVTLLGLTCAY